MTAPDWLKPGIHGAKIGAVPVGAAKFRAASSL
jgi:hypothetical protein